MLVNTIKINDGHSVLEQNVTMTDQQISDGGVLCDVHCHADINRLLSEIYMTITYSTQITQECSRCLESFECSVEGKYSLVLKEKGALKSVDDIEDDYVDYGFCELDVIVDIRQSLYDELMLNLPAKPLCRKTCKGISEYAIGDEESGKPGKSDSIDPRWNKLKKLL